MGGGGGQGLGLERGQQGEGWSKINIQVDT